MKIVLALVFSVVCFAVEITPYMSSEHDVEKALLSVIEKETKCIRVAMYTFTNKRIAKALGAAKDRGVAVEVLVDPFTDKISKVPGELVSFQIPVYLYNPKAQKCWTSILHHKFCLFESQQGVWTGSYNFTYKAENSNAENVLYITGDDNVYNTYKKEFDRIKTSRTEQVTQKEPEPKMKK